MTTLTIVMIAGVLTIVALLVIRLQAPQVAPLPAEITLPDGAAASTFTQGRDWYAVVTDADEILIYDRQSGALRQRVQITPAQP